MLTWDMLKNKDIKTQIADGLKMEERIRNNYEELMAMVDREKHKEIYDQLRYLRDDEEKHIGLVRMILNIV